MAGKGKCEEARHAEHCVSFFLASRLLFLFQYVIRLGDLVFVGGLCTKQPANCTFFKVRAFLAAV